MSHCDHILYSLSIFVVINTVVGFCSFFYCLFCVVGLVLQMILKIWGLSTHTCICIFRWKYLIYICILTYLILSSFFNKFVFLFSFCCWITRFLHFLLCLSCILRILFGVSWFSKRIFLFISILNYSLCISFK